MTTTATTTWHERIFSSGFVTGSGPSTDVVEKATGETLGRVGSAGTGDLDKAVSAARAAQRDWAAAPYQQRADVLLRAAALLEAEPDRLVPWLVRESGSGPGKAGFELGLVVDELREAAATASAPYGRAAAVVPPAPVRWPGTSRSASSA